MPLHGAFKVHLIFYRVETEELDVFRVLHGMRDLPRRLTQPPGASDCRTSTAVHRQIWHP